jgi:hypothetical protein
MRPVVTRGALLVWLVVVALLGVACQDAKPAPVPATATPSAAASAGSTPIPVPEPVHAVPPDFITPRDRVIDIETGAIREFPPEATAMTRGGTAIWVRTASGLELQTLDGRLVDRLEGADAVEEAANGAVRLFRSGHDRDDATWYVQVSGQPPRNLGKYLWPALSPGGASVAFYRFTPARNWARDFLVIDTHSGEEYLVAADIGALNIGDGGAKRPRWSPSGTLATYVSVEGIRNDQSLNLLVYDVRSRQSRSVRRGATLPFEYWLDPRDALVFERAGAVWIADFEVGTERVLLAPACSGLGIFGRDLIRYERPRAGLSSSGCCAHYDQREDVFVDLRSGTQITSQQAERLMEDRDEVLPVVLRRFTRKDCREWWLCHSLTTRASATRMHVMADGGPAA